MDLLRIAVRCLFSFLFLFVAVRLSGKRFVSEGTAFDFVLGLIIGDLVDNAIFQEVPMAQFTIAAGMLVLAEVTASLLVHKYESWMWLLEGKPRIIVQKGNLNREATRQTFTRDEEVYGLLRLKGIEKEKLHQIALATLEASGDVAILKVDRMRDAQKKERHSL